MCSCTGGCSCTTNSTRLPIGPTGATGATGAAGAAGANGSSGTTVIIGYTNATGVTQPASAVETSLYLETIPANTILGNNDELEIYIYLEATSGAGATTSTIRLKLGGLTIVTDAISTATITNTLLYKIRMTRTALGAQLWTYERLLNSSTPALSSTILKVATAMDETINNDFQVTAQGSGATAGQFTLYKATIYKYSA